KFSATNADRMLFQARLASAYGEAGNFAGAMELFARILSQANNQVALQIEAATTLQHWGDAGNQAAYLKAITGDRPDPQTRRNLIWGYGRIAKATAGRAAFDEIFFNSRLQVANCRYQYGLQQSAAQRRETLQQAEQDVLLTAKLYPRLRELPIRSQYQQLLRDIQRTLGKTLTELP
ncbi:MAG: hypothetical protein KDB23_09060, partial [Planctomycetales bacterium]|nr:hypothetical protein [Planctomycetales bacterium]